MRVKLLEVERSCSLRQGVQIHGKEVYGKFSVEIVQLIMVFLFFRETFRKFLLSSQIVRTFLVDTLVDAKNGTFFYNREDMTTMRAFDGNHLRLIRCKGMGADSTLELTFATIVIIDLFMRGATTRTDGICRNVTIGILANGNRLNQFIVAFVEVFDEFLIVELFALDDFWGLVYFKFLVLRRVGVIESPLFERYIFADK